MWARGRAAVGVLMLAGWACGRTSPATPTTLATPSAGDAPLVTAGAYVLAVAAPDQIVVDGRLTTACAGAGVANLALIYANAVVTVTDTVAHARPATIADGTFDLRLAWNGTSTSAAIHGVVVNTMMPPGGPVYDARATFDAPTDVPLLITSKTPIVTGTVFGNLTVSNNGGGTAIACNPGTAQWTLSRVLR